MTRWNLQGRFSARMLTMLGIALGVFSVQWSMEKVPGVRVWWSSLERGFQDWVHRIGRTAPIDPSIVVLGIDEATLTMSSESPEELAASPVLQLMAEDWPFSRAVHAAAIEKLLDAGARAVVVDLFFERAQDPEGDEALRRVLDAHPGKVRIVSKFEESYVGLQRVFQFRLPAPELIPWEMPIDARLGYANYWPEALDSVIREVRFRTTPSEAADGEAHPDEPVLAALSTVTLEALGQGDRIPKGTKPVRFRFADPGRAFPPISFREIFIPRFWEANFDEGAWFKDRVIYIGPTAEGFKDNHPTPHGQLAGVRIHAHVVNAALQDEFLTQWPMGLRWTVTLAAGLGAFLIVAWPTRTLVSLASLAALGGGVFALGIWLFNVRGVEMMPLGPLVGLSATGLLCLSYDFVLERLSRNRLHRALSRYVSPNVAAEILRQPEGYYAAAGGESRVVTTLFSDVRGFTSLAESRTPAELVEQLNEYLGRMVEVVFTHSGSIDKFIGDAVMAVWGGIQTEADEGGDLLQIDAVQAAGAALDMYDELDALNQRWKAEGIPELNIGIGIHQGDAIVGDIGSSQRSDFTVIGDSVNLASRLEGLTKGYRVRVLVSDRVHERIADSFVCRNVDLVRVYGKKVPVGVHAVLCRKEDGAPAWLAGFEEGIRAFRERRFGDALDAFEGCGERDALTEMYVKRCKEFIETPPGEDWDGVVTMKGK